MNQTDFETDIEESVKTADPIDASYLLCACGSFGDIRMRRNQGLYVFTGDGIEEIFLRYRAGKAVVDPLAVSESYRLLLELSEKDSN